MYLKVDKKIEFNIARKMCVIICQTKGEKMKNNKLENMVNSYSQEMTKLFDEAEKDYTLIFSPLFHKKNPGDHYIRGLRFSAFNNKTSDEVSVECTYMLRNGKDFETLGGQNSLYVCKEKEFNKISKKWRKENDKLFITKKGVVSPSSIKYIQQKFSTDKYKKIFNKDIIPLELLISIRPNRHIFSLVYGNFDYYLYNAFLIALYPLVRLIYDDCKYLTIDDIHQRLVLFNKKIV
jgi:hypothetical protein